jgi:uroporphyrinogen-III decarboxylase
MIKLESVEDAVRRSLQTMMEWGDENKAEFNHYFNYVNLNRAVHDILNGRISCWVILNCAEGKRMIGKMSDEQLDMIAPAFDMQFWIKHFKQVSADVALVKEICDEVGIK